jgi:hypothetical protein
LRVFDLFRELVKNPASLRLLVLVLRQTDTNFTRILSPLLNNLGWDVTHPTRAVAQLEQALERLRSLDVVQGFTIDRASDRVSITVNRGWFQPPG